MRQSARVCLAPGTSVGPGEVLVATELGDPALGLLPCPAAPLVGGVLERRGVRVRYGPVPHFAEMSQADSGAAMFVTTSLLRDGEATGIAAAADAVDGVAAAAARAAVEECSAVAGPRRLLGAVSPWCPGAVSALELTRRAVAGGSQIAVVGQLAAGPADREELAAAGALFVTSLAQVPDGARVLFPAHGAAPADHEEAARRGLEVIDGTCPLVASLHDETQALAARGDQIVIVGHPSHGVTPGLAAQAPGRTATVDSVAGTGGVRAADPRRVSYVLQPGVPVEEMTAVSAALRSRFPALRGPDPDRFCYAASDRAETIRVVAAASDVVLVLGADGESDTRLVTGLARGGHAKVHVIGEPTGIVPSWLAGTAAIGLVETTSARPGLAADVTRALSGLGPLSVTTRRVTTEVKRRWRTPVGRPAPSGAGPFP